MSGGSYDYAFNRIDDLATAIQPTSALRKAFKRHLGLVAKACHDIEWVDSSDSSPGDEDDAIRACLGPNHATLALAEVLVDARAVLTELRETIAQVENEPTKGESRNA